MNAFLWNLLLALSWAVAAGDFTLAQLAAGFVLGYFVLLFAQPFTGGSRYFARVPRVIGFAFFYLWKLLLANLRVAYDVVTPTHHMKPGVIAIPLDATTDAEISLVANLITLTPGSLSVDISSDRRILYVHAMYIDNHDVEAARRDIKEGLERRVLAVLR